MSANNGSVKRVLKQVVIMKFSMDCEPREQFMKVKAVYDCAARVGLVRLYPQDEPIISFGSRTEQHAKGIEVKSV